MTRRLPLNPLITVLLAACAAAAIQPVAAAEPGGMRQQPLNPSAGNAERTPGPARPGPGPAGTPSRSPQGPADIRQSSRSTSIEFRGTRYLVTDGKWYERLGDELVAVAPPAGVLVRELPQGHAMRWIGGVPYFYAGGIYYLWRERQRRYEIVQSPPADEHGAVVP